MNRGVEGRARTVLGEGRRERRFYRDRSGRVPRGADWPCAYRWEEADLRFTDLPENLARGHRVTLQLRSFDTRAEASKEPGDLPRVKALAGDDVPCAGNPGADALSSGLLRRESAALGLRQ